MRGGSPIFFLVIIVFLCIVDAYTFRGVRTLSANLQPIIRNTIYVVYWLVPVVVLILLAWLSLNMETVFTTSRFKVWYFLMGLFVLFYVPKLVFIIFQVVNDLVRISGFVLSKVSADASLTSEAGKIMTRADFLLKAGILVAAIPFVSVLQGITFGRFNYKVKNIKLDFPNLPPLFNGLRVLQISDWHIGSFYSQPDKVEKAVRLINEQNADIILFTGDMVNNTADELKMFVPILQNLRAKHGVYSVLGNHDYGEYVAWKSEAEHAMNMQNLYRFEKESGFRLLLNESVVIEKGKEKIGIAGVENWGLPPFPQYGNLTKTLSGLQDVPFIILMSHDPSHWDAEVLNKSKVDLTLSGHTHGMQFGINIPGFKWSPVKWKYPRWSGLYSENNQRLYVNVGIGYIGFPGRVGFYPEITVFELYKENNS